MTLEETVYRPGHKNNYFADPFGIDVLTDTTERSPTYCTPPFRKFDDTHGHRIVGVPVSCRIRYDRGVGKNH